MNIPVKINLWSFVLMFFCWIAFFLVQPVSVVPFNPHYIILSATITKTRILNSLVPDGTRELFTILGFIAETQPNESRHQPGGSSAFCPFVPALH